MGKIGAKVAKGGVIDPYHLLVDYLKSHGKIPTPASVERNRFLISVKTSRIADVTADLLAQLAELTNDADSLMLNASVTVAAGSDDAGRYLANALDFWGTLFRSLEALQEIGVKIGTEERILAVAQAVRQIEAADSPYDIYPVLTTLAAEATWWHNRISAEIEGAGG